MPVQLTTYSASMAPKGVSTPVTTPRFVRMPVAGTFSSRLAPWSRAPFASASVTFTGSTFPSSFT